ncbi:mitochondrial substrate carrier family protein E-like [Vigna radiata var. radiata]|uniref:Mitochondrial substrate carrier family protein E-like n=1 Tax=Vigna radiata var. radiata TaxID=3916 RepID=A0A3Q0F708_VIGRR|nr:mitochondrial substrate carrier family protein E-like [Vigna radiata var. radiata]
MSSSPSTYEESQPHPPQEIDWHMLDKSKFFCLGTALFSAVSAALYPAVVLKTRQQMSAAEISCRHMSRSIMRYEGLRGFYRGFGTSLLGTIPARALYMSALEVTKSKVASATLRWGFSDASATAIANAAGGVASAMAAQLVWTPVDVVSQRLMVQGVCYRNGFDAFRKILGVDGPRGFYRGFGVSIVTYAPSNAVWWASYSIVQKLIWGTMGSKEGLSLGRDSRVVMGVQGLSAVMASGVCALVTMPLDTIKTRLQVLEAEEVRVIEVVRDLVREGGVLACYRGLGPRCVSMSMSAAAMITTYEFLKRVSAKNVDRLALYSV